MSTTLNPSTAPLAPEADAPAGIDPRGPQFAASLTAVVLIALGAARGVQRTPHAWLFKTLVRPRLSAPTELEAPEPPRFAQAVGLGFTVVALVAYAAGGVVVAQTAIGFALVAALLNAVFRFCLGCEMYLLFRRATS